MAVRFDAATDRISYNGPTTPPAPATAITVTMWAHLSVDRNDWSTFLRIWNAASSTVGTFITTTTGTTLQYATGGGTNTPGFDLTVGQWSRLAFTVTGTQCRAYGAPATGNTVTSQTTVSGAANPTGFTLGGRHPADPAEWFNGRLAHVRIWPTTLTQTEIEAEWASTTPVRTADLWAAYPLSSASDLLDASGNGRHLTAGTTAVTTEDDPPITPPTVTGALTATAPAATMGAAGTPVVVGQLVTQPAGPEMATGGGLVVGGQAAATAPAFTAAMAGAVEMTGTVTAQAPAFAAQAAGEVINAGSAALTAGGPELAAHGAVGTGTGTLVLTAPAGALTTGGQVINPGTVTATAPAATMVASGTADTPVAGIVQFTAPAFRMAAGNVSWPPAVQDAPIPARVGVEGPLDVPSFKVS